MKDPDRAQPLAVKRAQVEFHNFASLGEPERALAAYARENRDRGALLRKHADLLGDISPFLEIGANAGHTSYLLVNEFGADGFALDISADSLRHGIALMDAWGYAKAPVRLAGDALRLPFADGALRLVLACQMLSQFQDIEAVFEEVKRVLAPGGVFVFVEEPLKRMLSLRLYRAPYYEAMKPWERRLFDRGLLGFLVRDVIGAQQEESFGIRQNHRFGLAQWHALVTKHFAEHRYEVFVPERGWAERAVRRLGRRIDRHGTDWLPARLLGGTLAALCRKAGSARPDFDPAHFEHALRCPDCGGNVNRDAGDTLRCRVCAYEAANEGGVYNLLRSADRAELYPGDRPDIIDFSLPGHEAKLGCGWHAVEGVYGNKYRWMGSRAEAVLQAVRRGPARLRMRGFAAEGHLPVLTARCGGWSHTWTIGRPGLFVLEADLPEAPEYRLAIEAAPAWRAPGDPRELTVNFSRIRLV